MLSRTLTVILLVSPACYLIIICSPLPVPRTAKKDRQPVVASIPDVRRLGAPSPLATRLYATTTTLPVRRLFPLPEPPKRTAGQADASWPLSSDGPSSSLRLSTALPVRPLCGPRPLGHAKAQPPVASKFLCWSVLRAAQGRPCPADTVIFRPDHRSTTANRD